MLRYENGRRALRRAGTVAAIAAATLGAASSATAAEFGLQSLTAEAVSRDASGNEAPFTQAGGHPDALRIAFRVNTQNPDTNNPEGYPIEELKDVTVDLPDGLQGNPMATPRCPNELVAQFGVYACPQSSIVGFHVMRWVNALSGTTDPQNSAVYNMAPPEGVVARFAFSVATVTTYLDMRVNDDGRYTISTDIRNISTVLGIVRSETVLFGTPAAYNGMPAIAGMFGTPGTDPQVPMLTLGHDCDAPQRVGVDMRSWQRPGTTKSFTAEMPALTGCEDVPFAARMSMAPDTTQAASPAGFTARIDVPQEDAPRSIAPSLLKRVEVALPTGVAINPPSAQGLVGCTDDQVRLRASGAPTCPDASKIGTVEIETPVLPGPLKGDVHLGQPKSMVAANGDMFRVFLVAKGHGVTIKQEGRITPDPVTGQLRAVFDEIAQQPFSRLTVAFNGGPRAPLSTPAQCGEHTTVATLTATSGKQLTSESSFSIACRDGLFGFAPSFAAGVDNPLAGASSPLRIAIGRPDGQRALTGVNLAMPKGLLANLKGNVGQVVGSVRAYAGLGSEPFGLPGTVTLEGPYGDAPFSLKVVVPAKAGPYDLGDVVVRQKLYVHPDTTQVTTVSDPLPTILQGVPVQLQRLDVAIDKPGFMINPTRCDTQRIDAGLTSEAGQGANGSSRLAIGGCRELRYAPKLGLKLDGPAKELRNGGHPELHATLTAGKGEANQRKAQVTLPLNLALDPQNAKALCEPSQVPASSCPAESIVGSAKAVSILDVPLEGPVYFVRGERTTSTGRTVATLPKLFIPLKGQGVTVNLHASSDVVDQKLQTTFDNLPDAPIESFDLKIAGGANGILKVTNGDVCKVTSTPQVGQRLSGQNGRVVRATSTLGTTCRTAIVAATQSGSRLAVTVGGLGDRRARVTVSGSGLKRTSRTIGATSTVATVKPQLNAAQRRALRAGRTVRIKVTAAVKPTAKGSKTTKVTKTVVVKPAKK